MEKLADATKTIFSQFIEDYPSKTSQFQFKVYPQMPMEQIRHYIKLAARKNKFIIVQLNPSSFSNKFTEVSGQIKLSPKSSQIILTPRNGQTVHLIQSQFVRHIRLTN